MSAMDTTLLEPRALRSVFGRFATGVAVVTTRDGNRQPVGVTVNSFTSVSLAPPLILFCILNNASNYRLWESARRFTVNILTERQQAQSNALARPTQASWEQIPHHFGDNDCPVLEGAAAVIECEHHAHCDGGDHLIVIGRVLRCREAGEEAPLLYYRGRYAQLDVYPVSR